MQRFFDFALRKNRFSSNKSLAFFRFFQDPFKMPKPSGIGLLKDYGIEIEWNRERLYFNSFWKLLF